jgi:hypothetical protein
MNAQVQGPVWIDPPRFWAAAAGKSEAEISDLLDHIVQLWNEGKREALLRFDFVTGAGYPYPSHELSAAEDRGACR